jgi:hypothetical protein
MPSRKEPPNIVSWKPAKAGFRDPDEFVNRGLSTPAETSDASAAQTLTELPAAVSDEVPPGPISGNLVQLTCRIPEPLQTRLRTISALARLPIQQIVTDALEAHLPKLAKKIPKNIEL